MRNILFTLLFLLALPYTLVAQNVTNIRAYQDGENIIITYDLAQKGTYIRLYMASGESERYTELNAVTGDVGENISLGRNLQIVWSPLKENANFVAQNVRLKITDNLFY